MVHYIYYYSIGTTIDKRIIMTSCKLIVVQTITHSYTLDRGWGQEAMNYGDNSPSDLHAVSVAHWGTDWLTDRMANLRPINKLLTRILMVTVNFFLLLPPAPLDHHGTVADDRLGAGK